MTTAGRAPLWAETSGEGQSGSDPLPTDVVDVAVVGGGYTGLSTALHGAEKGLAVHVVEARRIGHGGSGRNVGLVNAGLWLPPGAVRTALGDTFGPRFLRRFADGPRSVFDLAERHQIRCAITKTGTIHAAHAQRAMADLRARHAEWISMGEPVELLDREAIAARSGTRAFAGGLLDHRAGTLNPMAYARGLARAARAAGAGISHDSPAHRLIREGGWWRLETATGDFRARAVVLATNAYTDGLWPGLSQTFTGIHYFQLATEPIRGVDLSILPERQGLWTTAPVMWSVRRDADDRLVIGSMGRVLGNTTRGASVRWARNLLLRLFPDRASVWARIRFEAAWDGQIAMTADHLPKLARLADGVWCPIGYNGRGITTGTIFGQVLADLLSGAAPESLPIPVTEGAPKRAPFGRAPLLDLAFTVNQLWRSV